MFIFRATETPNLTIFLDSVKEKDKLIGIINELHKQIIGTQKQRYMFVISQRIPLKLQSTLKASQIKQQKMFMQSGLSITEKESSV